MPSPNLSPEFLENALASVLRAHKLRRERRVLGPFMWLGHICELVVGGLCLRLSFFFPCPVSSE